MSVHHIVLLILVVYFMILLTISYLTTRHSTSQSFYLGDRKASWYVIAFGMISASLSGVTFLSVPGWVKDSSFSYMQMVLGYLVGYFIIARVLLPLYYRMNLTSIYTYLQERFGWVTYRTGAVLFLVSRSIGTAFRLFLVANVLYLTMFKSYGVSFEITVLITIFLIWLYTFKGGIKTIIWTDCLQTIFMLASVGITIIVISKELGYDFNKLVTTIYNSEYSQVFYFDDIKSKVHFAKQFLSGIFMAIVMTGLDQDMMQKNLSCKDIKSAQKNMYWFSIALVPVNLLFLSLGAVLMIYATSIGYALPVNGDDIYVGIATAGGLPKIVMVMFIFGLVAAAYSSADSALAALTTSFTVDILNAQKYSDEKNKRIRMITHVGVSIFLAIIIIVFKMLNNQSVIQSLFTFAGYTYGPLLGLFAFGLITKYKVYDKWIPVVCIIAPLLSYVLSFYSTVLLDGYKFGFEILLVNGIFTFIGLIILSKRATSPN